MQSSFRIAAESFPKREVAHRRRMENGVPSFVGECSETQAQIVCRRERLHARRASFAAPGGLLADEQRYLMSTFTEMGREFRAESASGMVREPPNLIERFV